MNVDSTDHISKKDLVIQWNIILRDSSGNNDVYLFTKGSFSKNSEHCFLQLVNISQYFNALS